MSGLPSGRPRQRGAAPSTAPVTLMKSMLFGMVVSVLLPAGVQAATLINTGSEAVVVQVSEASGRMDVSLDPGAQEDICPSGCFLTLPSGDRIGLAGGETIELENGTAHIK